MSDFVDLTEDAVEQARGSGLNTAVALLVTLTAAFVALCNVKDGNIVQAMAQAQANSVDAWSYYQAKSTKQNFAEGMVDQISLQRDTTPGISADGARRVRPQDRRLHRQGQAVRRREGEDQAVRRGLPEASTTGSISTTTSSTWPRPAFRSASPSWA